MSFLKGISEIEISDIEKADGRKIHFSNADLKMTELNPAIEDKYFPQFTYLGKSSFLENYLGSLNRDPKVTKMPKEVAYVLGPETCEKYFIKKWEEKLGPNIAKMFRDACAKVFDEDNSIFFEVDGVPIGGVCIQKEDFCEFPKLDIIRWVWVEQNLPIEIKLGVHAAITEGILGMVGENVAGGIFSHNIPSIKIAEKLGFRIRCATFLPY
ncbi:MAG TPA: hypothetical protein DCL41_02795 [Bdellovibrionales bacterium]|nr:hypothetical protein [Pseudobdellovibrionaceae bacterium]HAG90769.1 hypothetical protein [Bdellovibrionales bacterium]